MEDNNITSWEHFKKNYLLGAIFLIGLFITSLTLELVRDTGNWYFSFFFLLLAGILPIGNHISWKKKFGKK